MGGWCGGFGVRGVWGEGPSNQPHTGGPAGLLIDVACIEYPIHREPEPDLHTWA